MTDLSRARMTPHAHQVVGVDWITSKPYMMLGDEMRLGKSKQVIDAVEVMRGEINRVIVVCPNTRFVWYDPTLGQLAQHLWEGSKHRVIEYHTKTREWGQSGGVTWIVTNYEFLTSKERLARLKNFANSRTLLVLDESSYVKSHRALRTKACMAIRRDVGRVVLLNGTPVSHSPGDMYSQGALMNPRILSCLDRRGHSSYHVFRSRYAQMGGFQQKQIVGWYHQYRVAGSNGNGAGCCDAHDDSSVHSWPGLEDIRERFAPYVLRRLTSDCFDLPDRVYETTSVQLTPVTWRVYKEMRDDMVAWLDQQIVSVTAQAGVKAMRLSQVCSGFLGGLQDADGAPVEGVRQVGTEKAEHVVQWVRQMLEEDPAFKLVLWCRFRPEVEMYKKLLEPLAPLGLVWGQQPQEERDHALRLLHPKTAPAGPAIVVGTPSAGSMAINLAAAHHELYTSNDVKLAVRLQSEARVAGPEQKEAVWVGDLVATGPNGQKTIDHTVVRALREKQDLAAWTCAAWRRALEE